MENVIDPTPLETIDQGNPTTIEFFLADSTDHKSPKTGLAASTTAKISKAGGAFASPTNSVTEIGLGWYKLTLTATETNTAGVLILSAVATGADPVEQKFQVLPSQAVNNTSFSFPQGTGVYVYLQQAVNLPNHGNTLSTAANR
jgi:hypothetical protein